MSAGSGAQLLALLLTLALLGIPSGSTSGDAVPEWQIIDPEGDIQVEASLGPPSPSTPLNDAMDLRRVWIAEENVTHLAFRVQVGDFLPATTFSDSFGHYRLQIRFRYEELPIEYRADVFLVVGSPLSGAAQPVFKFPRGVLCIAASIASPYCYEQRFQVKLDAEENQIGLEIPKPAFTGQWHSVYCIVVEGGGGCESRDKEPPKETPLTLHRGDRIHGFFVRFSPRSDTVGWYDQAPNSGEGPEYRLRHDGPNGRLSFIPKSAEIRVELGKVHLWPVRLSNTAVEERRLRFGGDLYPATAIGDYSTYSAKGFSLRFPRDVVVPPLSTISVPFLIETEPESYGNVAEAQLRATAVEHPEEVALIRAELSSAATPTLQRPVVFLHHREVATTASPFAAIQEAQCAAREYCGTGWFNALQNDPLDTPQEKFQSSLDYLENDGLNHKFPFWDYEGFASDWALDPDRPIVVKLKLYSDVEARDVPVNVEWGEFVNEAKKKFTARGFTVATFGSSGTQVDVPLGVSKNFTLMKAWRVPPRLVVTLAGAPTNPASLAIGFQPNGYKLSTQESQIELPLVGSPVRVEVVAAGESVRVAAAAYNPDLADYRGLTVAPSDNRLVNGIMFNEGPSDVFRLRTSGSSDWPVEFRPGDSFQVEQDGFFSFGVVVSSPREVESDSPVELPIEIVSESAGGVVAKIAVWMLPSKSAPKVDERRFYRDDPLALSSQIFTVPAKGIPGLGILSTLLFLGLGATLKGLQASRLNRGPV